MTISINITGETVEVVQRKLRDMAAALGGAVTITGTPPTADALIAKGKEIVKADAAKKSEKTAAPAPAAASSQTPATEPESAPTSES